MRPLQLLRLGSVFFATWLFLTGCGEKAPKVDVNAQISALAGNTEAKQNALTELATAGPAARDAVDKIIPLLKDPDPTVQRLAAYALGQIGPAAKSALPALKEALNTAERDVATGINNAIQSLESSSAAAAPSK